MPEFHQIQTYLDIQNSANDAVNRCVPFFSDLGWLNPAMQNWLAGFSWDVADDGIVYSGANGVIIEGQFDNQLLKIRPSFLGWTPKVIPGLLRNCLALELLIETEEIEDQTSWPNIRHLPEKSKMIWGLMKKASFHFSDFGVFSQMRLKTTSPGKGFLRAMQLKSGNLT